jgi:hypothetical protein
VIHQKRPHPASYRGIEPAKIEELFRANSSNRARRSCSR